MDNEAVINGCNLSDLVANIDNDTADGVGAVQLRNGALEDGKPGDVKALEEDLTDTLVSGPRKPWGDGEEDG